MDTVDLESQNKNIEVEAQPPAALLLMDKPPSSAPQPQDNKDEDPSANDTESIDSSVVKKAQDTKHLGGSRQYWRDIMLGVNDGLVSTFLLIAGVTGGGLSSTQILLTAISGALAGAISMAAGEFIATKAQNEVFEGEVKLERMHIKHCLDEEMEELLELLALIGIDEDATDLRASLGQYFKSRPESILKAMSVLEFGVLDSEVRAPWLAAVTSGMVFLLGSLPSVIPFIFCGSNQQLGLIIAGSITTVCLMAVGAIKSWATRGNCLLSSLENLVIAAIGAVLAYFIGFLVERALH